MSTHFGDFVHARRDATSPRELGLPDDGRRRVPGLRRSELAARAGISVEYLTRIEQGRDRNPSSAVINAIADALVLSAPERRHLGYLAKISGGACTAYRRDRQRPVRPQVAALTRRTLELFGRGVAMVSTRVGDILAFTPAFGHLMALTGLLDTDEPNLTRYVFTDARARTVFSNWEYLADLQAFDLRLAPTAATAEWFAEDLSETVGTGFTGRTARPLPPCPEPWQIMLDGVRTCWERQVLEIADHPDQLIVVLLAADAATATHLNTLIDESAVKKPKTAGGGRASALRAV